MPPRGRFVSSCFLLLLLVLPLFAAGAPPSGPAELIRAYNDQLAGKGAGPRRMAARDTLSLVRARAAAFGELIRTSPAQALALELPSETRARLASLPGAAPHIETDGAWTGAGRTFVEDDFTAARARRVNQLDTGSETLEVQYASEPPAPKCGQRLQVQGVRLGNAVAAASASVVAPAASDPAASACATPTGDRRVAIVLLSFPSTPLPANVTAATVQNAFFGAGRSLDGYWREVSYGKTSASGSVFGPFVMSSDWSCGDMTNITRDALAVAQGSVTFANYTHIYFVFPKNGDCAVGTGSIGCWRQSSPQGTLTSGFVWMPVTADTSQDELSVIAAHEGGHNLGLEHAASVDYGSEPLGPPGSPGAFDEYGDRYSVMGIAWSINGNFGFGHYSAQHKLQLGWLQNEVNVQTVQSGGSFIINPYETPSAGVQALRVLRGTGGASWLWLEYRQPDGTDDPSLRFYSQTVFQGALVHFDDPSDTAHAGYTKLLRFNPGFNNAALAAGQTWKDPYSTLSLHVDSASASGLSVTVAYAGDATPQLAASAVSAADGSTVVAPGSIVSIYGAGLAPSQATALSYPLPAMLAGTTVEIVAAGTVRDAPLYFVSPGQINAQLPYDITAPAQVRVRAPSGASVALDLQYQPAAPRLFTSDMTGKGTAAALRWPAYSLVGTAAPVRAGDTIMVFGTGLGSVSPAVAAGSAAGDGSAGGPLNVCDAQVQASIGAANATVFWAGLAPGFSGLYQINLQVPAGLATGNNALVLKAGGVASQSGVTVPVIQ